LQHNRGDEGLRRAGDAELGVQRHRLGGPEVGHAGTGAADSFRCGHLRENTDRSGVMDRVHLP
jgi:hypothetical protein